MGRKKQNRSKQRKAARAAEEATRAPSATTKEPTSAPTKPEFSLLEFHSGDDLQGLLEHLHKEKKIDCIKLAKFLPNTAADVRNRTVNLEDVLRALLAKYKATFGLVHENDSFGMHIANAILGLGSEASIVKETCWECGKAQRQQQLLRCTGCRVACYCGRGCQYKAWKLGHNKKCATLQGKYKGFQESIAAIEEVHGNFETRYPGAEFDIASDYSMLRIIHTVPIELEYLVRHIDGVEGQYQQGPSMKVFYENLHRIQTGDWWILSEPETVEAYMTKGLSGKEEYANFSTISCLLSYEMLGTKSMAERCGQYPDLLNLMLNGMPAERYVQLYQREKATCLTRTLGDFDIIDGEYPDGKGRWKKTRRLLKRLAVERFRAHHHAGPPFVVAETPTC